MPQDIVPVSWDYLHLEDHRIVLPEQSESVSQIIRGYIEPDNVITIDDKFIGRKYEFMIFDSDIKDLVRFIITSVQIHRRPWYGIVGYYMKGHTKDGQKSNPGIK
jgi:hypothetical protein